MIALHKSGAGKWQLVVAMAAAAYISGCDNSQMRQNGGANAEPAWVSGTEKPPEAKTLFAMARLLAAQGKDQQAQFVFEKIIAQQPDFMQTYVELAELHMRQDRPEMARSILRQGLKCRPDDGVLLNNLGMTYAVKGDYAAAQKLFEQAVKASPGSKTFKTNLAMANGMQGQYDQSLATYRQVLPPDQAHYNVAVLAEARNDSVKARRQFVLSETLAAPTATTQPCPSTTQPAGQ